MAECTSLHINDATHCVIVEHSCRDDDIYLFTDYESARRYFDSIELKDGIRDAGISTAIIDEDYGFVSTGDEIEYKTDRR